MKTTTLQRTKTRANKQTSREDFLERLHEQLKSKTVISGGALVVAALEALAPENPGIKHIAGHHGGAILPFYEYYTKSDLHQGYIHAPNEQIAGFIAKGYANTHADVGVAVATSGPGATNLITPFYDAKMDSVPVVFITGNVTKQAAGSMAFQEAPIIDMIAPIAKRAYYVQHTKDIPKTLYEAFITASTGRPGPVWIDFPKDVQKNTIRVQEIIQPAQQSSKPSPKISLEKIKEPLRTAKKPVIYAGGGVKSADAWRQLRIFAQKHRIPVTTTLKAKGVYPETCKLSLGMLGMHGTAYANHAVDKADFLLVIGARFDDRVTSNPETFAQNAHITHIDIDPRGIGPNKRQPHLTIQTDAKTALEALNNLDIHTQNYTAWHKQIQKWKETYPLDYNHTTKQLKPQHAIELLYASTNGEHAIVADVGQHQMWAAQHYLTSIPNGFDTSAGSGTMGCALAQALGSWLARQEAGDKTRITAIIGDESFMMNPQTLQLYKQFQPNILAVIIDNKATDGTPGGMVRQWYDSVHNNTQLPVPGSQQITNITKGFGIPAVQASTPAQTIQELTNALSTDGPYLIQLKVDSTENCLPMLPPGKTIKDMITYQSNTHK